MDLRQTGINIWRWLCKQYFRVPELPRNVFITLFLLFLSFLVSSLLRGHTGGENNSALVFSLAVATISFLTDGYFYGISASIISVFFVNVYFMVPYAQFSLNQTGYPLAMLSMVTISCLICALTSKVKHLAVEAVRREKSTKELYALNEKLNAEKAAIQLESDRETMRSNILRAVSHDLRTPLTAISGSAAVLLSSPDISEKNMSMIHDIKNDADTLIIMVENLLSVTRIQDGTLPLKMREEMLEEVVGDAVLTTRRRFPNAQVTLDLSEDILYLPMDPLLIKQVIVNLLENSIRHSGDTEFITLRMFRQDNYAVLEVRDRGKGLSPEVCQAIRSGSQLKRDQSGDSTRGMGIGLSVCQSIIKAHNGYFTAANNPEGGAVFRFGLPMEEPVHE